MLGVTWPVAYGGRGLTKLDHLVVVEEFSRARVPVGSPGDTLSMKLLGNTLAAWGTHEQKLRFLPRIISGEDIWCQGYSEPEAGSDLAGLKTKAVRDGDGWSIHGQKVWTSLAQDAHWCFVLARTNPDAPRHEGISCLLVPMDQPGVRVVPIRQLTGSSEFCEVFFDGARAEHVVGPVDGGWKVAMATLAFERGASTLGQQVQFRNELRAVIARAKATGRDRDPLVRDRIADLWMRLRVMRHHALRALTAHHGGRELPAGSRGSELPREAMIGKLWWATWHRDLGELAMDVLGDDAAVLDDGEVSWLHRLFLWSRSDTIYAGTNEIQRNLIAQRALGLPR
jgi:alkylation response protein AidB-like acyl-CoA dehydrogenase